MTDRQPTTEKPSPYGENHPATDDRPEPDIREEIVQKGDDKEANPGKSEATHSGS